MCIGYDAAGYLTHNLIRHSIVASIPACHAGDRGSIPRDGVTFETFSHFAIYFAHNRLTFINIINPLFFTFIISHANNTLINLTSNIT